MPRPWNYTCSRASRRPASISTATTRLKIACSATPVARPRGCPKCMNMGYRGRVGIFEVLELDDELRELVKVKASSRAYREIFVRRKIRSLRRAGFEKVVAGLTTVDEVLSNLVVSD